jgi:undecaprenyl-diphosphatase
VNSLDRQILLWVNSWPESFSPVLTFFSVAMNFLAVKLCFLALFIAMVWRGSRSRTAALLALPAVGIANGMTDLFKHLLPMHRPFQPEMLGSEVILRVGYSGSMGTASAHAANMAALAFVFTAFLGRWGWLWIGIALVTGMSRVYTGAHFPSQVLLGWTCGCAAGAICWGTFRFFTRSPKETT